MSNNVKKLKLLESFVSDDNKQNAQQRFHRSVNGEQKYVEQLQIEKIKLTQGMDYLRKRITNTQADHRRVLDQIIDIKRVADQQRKLKEQALAELRQQQEGRKKLEDYLNNNNTNFCVLQKKYNALQIDNSNTKQKYQKLQQKYSQLVNKRNNHFNCILKQKGSAEKLANLEKELTVVKEKNNELRHKLDISSNKEQHTNIEIRKLKKVIEEKDQSLSQLKHTIQMLENDSIRESTQSKEMLESLMNMVKAKQTELQAKEKQLLDCEPMMQRMAEQMQKLLEKNKILETKMQAPNIQKLNKDIYEKFKETFEISKRLEKWDLHSTQRLSRLVRSIKEQYQQLETLYDKLVSKYYHHSRSTSVCF